MEILILPNISDNLYAEIFLRTAGARFTPQGKSTGSTMRDGFIQVSQVQPAHPQHNIPSLTLSNRLSPKLVWIPLTSFKPMAAASADTTWYPIQIKSWRHSFYSILGKQSCPN